MVTRNFGKVQEALNALNPVEQAINELQYYKKYLSSPNHSSSICSSVRSSISTLDTQHSEVVNALMYYGETYVAEDVRLAYGNNPEYAQSMGLSENGGFSYTQAAEHQKSGWEKFWNQIILGDFSDDFTWAGTAGAVILDFTPIGWVQDGRDVVANISKGSFWGTALAAVGFIPLVSSLGKVGKTAAKGAKVVDAGSNILKHGDDIAGAGSTILKQGSNIAETGSSILKQGDNLSNLKLRTINGVVDGIKDVDDVASLGKVIKGERVLVSTTNNNIYKIVDDGYLKISNGITETTVKNVNVIENFNYVKKDIATYEKLFDDFYGNAGKGISKTDTVQVKFIQDLALKHSDELKKAGFSDDVIEGMLKGKAPQGFQVHHKLSLDDGGSNDFSNLILIDKKSHSVFTAYQNSSAIRSKLKLSDNIVVDWPIPSGRIYSGININTNVLQNIDSLRIPYRP